MPDFPIRRKPLSRTTRFEIFKRDGFKCQYCGRCPPDVLLEIDHITPVAEGGDDDFDNLITACFDCNRGKAARLLDVVPRSLADRAAEIAEREAQLQALNELLKVQATRLEEDTWRVAFALFANDDDEQLFLKYNHKVAIKRFLKVLPLQSVLDAAEIARGRVTWHDHRRFLYFCKVCWNQIKDGD